MNFLHTSIKGVQKRPVLSFLFVILCISLVVSVFLAPRFSRAAAETLTCADGETRTISVGTYSGVSGTEFTADAELTLNGYGNCTFVLVQTDEDAAISLDGFALDSGVTLTHPTTSFSGYYKIDLDVNGPVIVSGTIYVSGRGYLGGRQGDNSATNRGVYKDNSQGSYDQNGGTHGGKGGRDNGFVVYDPYDSITNPVYPGGGGGAGSATLGQEGGNGGGVIRISGTSITGGGDYFADGASSTYGGGAGGSIYLNANGGAINVGLVSANGGDSSGSKGGGGGGRIALVDSISRTYSHAVRGGTSGAVSAAGSAGTLYLKTSVETYGNLVIDNDTVDDSSFATTLPSPVPDSDAVAEFGDAYVFDSISVTQAGILNVPSGVDATSTGVTDFERKLYSSSCTADDDTLSNGEILYSWDSGTSGETNDYTCVAPERVLRFDLTTASSTESTTTTEILVELAGPTTEEVTFSIDMVAASTTATVTDDFSTSTSGGTIAVSGTSTFYTVTIVNDSLEEEDEDIVLQLVSPVNATTSLNPYHTYTIANDDTAGVTLDNGGGITATEGGATGTYTLVLDTQPSADVEITLSADIDLSVSSSTITFTSEDWDTPQTIIVTAEDDALVEGEHVATVSHTVSSSDPNYDDIAADSATVTVTDNDTAGVIITESDAGTAVSESGTTDDYTVVLSSAPASDVTVSVATDTEVTVSTSTIVFTADNWDTAVTVTVTAVDDEDDEGEHGSTITHTSASEDGDFDELVIENVSVTVTDNDAAGATLTQSSGSTKVYEPSTTDSYTVVLHRAPTDDVTVSLVTDAEITLSTSSIVFTTDNWESAVTVTVTPVDDEDAEGTVTGTITHSFSSLDLGYNALDDEVITYSKIDNDLIEITESDGVTLLSESVIESDTVEYVLALEPTSPVIIDISSDDEEVNVSTSTISFSAANWDTPVTVTFSIFDDEVDNDDRTANITYTVTSVDDNYNEALMSTTSISITEDDSSGLSVTVAGNVSEAGATTTLSVTLTSKPTGDVYLYDDLDGGHDLTEGTISTSSLTFTPLNWSTPQTIIVTGVDDDIDDGNIEGFTVFYPLASSTDSRYHGNRYGPYDTTNVDDDTAGITVSDISGNTTEAGGTATFTVVLDSEPTSTVTIGVSSSDETEGTVSPTTLTFTTENWDTPQTVTVTGVNDNDEDGDTPYTIILAVASSESDTNYDGMNPDDVSVTNTDNDPEGSSGGGGGGNNGGGGGGGGGGAPARRNVSPSQYSVVIEKGKETTQNHAVRVDIKGLNIDTIALSNFPDFIGSVYMPYTPEVSWDLLPGPGEKTVYVRLQTANGNMYSLSDTIEVLGSLPEVSDRPSVPEGSVADCALEANTPYKTNGSPKVYIVVPSGAQGGCVKEHLPSPLYYFSYFSSWNELEVVDEGTLASVRERYERPALGPRFIPYNGSIVQTPSDPTPYYILDGKKYRLSGSSAFNRMGFDMNWTQSINSGVLAGFPAAEALNERSNWPNGVVIRFSNIPNRAYQVLETTPDYQVRVKDLGLWQRLDDRVYRRDRIVVLEKNINVLLPSETIGPKVTISRFLTVGSVGQDVRYLQEKLKVLGYFTYESATGRYGYETASAVQRFQRDHGIDPRGYVGPATREMINSL